MIDFEKNIDRLIVNLKNKLNGCNASNIDFSNFINNDNKNLPKYIEVGKFKDLPNNIPALVPFVNEKGFVISQSDNDSVSEFNKYILYILIQIIYKFYPNNLELNIYDPIYLGSFYSKLLKDVPANIKINIYSNENDLTSILSKYIEYSVSLNTEKISNYDGFIDYWINSVDKDKKYYIFLLCESGFVKNNYIKDLINRISLNTKNNNSYFILTEHESKLKNYNFFNSKFIISNNSFSFYKNHKIVFDYELLDEKINNYSTLLSNISNTQEFVKEEYNINNGITIPIGKYKSNNKTFYFKFGNDTDCYNAIIGGQPGKGKSVLLDTIIRKGIENYDSNSLKFMLFDCKGVEFNEFQINDYILERESTPDVNIIIKKLEKINQEFENRRNLFKKHGVRSIEQLIQKGESLYRLICIIDEFQFLFPISDYKVSQFSEDMLVSKIIRTGRSFGIHLIVATQSLGDGVKASMLNNIPLRIALGMTEWQSASFLSSNNIAAKNLERGVAIYNSSNGELSANNLILIDKVE